MAKTIVSIRMPTTLVEQLKYKTKEEHFLDVSELVRSVVRKRFVRAQEPLSYEIQSLQKQLKKQFSSKVSEKQREWLLQQLKELQEGKHE